MINLYRNTVTNALHESPGEDRVHIGTYGELFNWSGGQCPISPETQIIAYFRARRPYVGPAIWPKLPAAAKAEMWHHAPHGKRTDPAADIVAYRVRVG